MGKRTKPGFYAVRVGRTPGVYGDWLMCLRQVNRWPGARYKKFPTEAEAWAFVGGAADGLQQRGRTRLEGQQVVEHSEEGEEMRRLRDDWQFEVRRRLVQRRLIQLETI
ncbi:hypothetical protein JCM8115_003210 [Rhodotorula mucilaginosa]|uniref:ribonuclease H n=1 Tax=Rhodotorula mucilaginosa TaxID=5537 RepID=A0A9P6W023_RHOMI|nr:Ribonuclease H1 [Rhodotorula mucilaginosa]TKA56203.1 hypothetical protein B0A53_01493 [Rhodotorula sp. CCFEE 5036]